LLLALVLGFLPAFAVIWSSEQLAGAPPAPGLPAGLGSTLRRLGVNEGIDVLATGFTWLFQGGVALIATADAAGGHLESVSELMRKAGRAPLIFLAGSVARIGILLGVLLLVIPGVLLSLAWVVGPAVAAVEGKGLIDIFRRSAALTRGNRAGLFGIGLVFGIGTIVLIFVLQLGIRDQPSLIADALRSALVAGVGAVWASANAAAYLELRVLKEGLTAGGLAAVFD
jgi:hypothetical protein